MLPSSASPCKPLGLLRCLTHCPAPGQAQLDDAGVTLDTMKTKTNVKAGALNSYLDLTGQKQGKING
jgi:hypothetical protein